MNDFVTVKSASKLRDTKTSPKLAVCNFERLRHFGRWSEAIYEHESWKFLSVTTQRNSKGSMVQMEYQVSGVEMFTCVDRSAREKIPHAIRRERTRACENRTITIGAGYTHPDTERKGSNAERQERDVTCDTKGHSNARCKYLSKQSNLAGCIVATVETPALRPLDDPSVARTGQHEASRDEEAALVLASL
jgi:hypothetical protein